MDDISLISDKDVLIASGGEAFKRPVALAATDKRLVGNYRIVSYLGKGSFGKVFKGVHSATNATAVCGCVAV